MNGGQININLFELQNLKCDQCGCIYFRDVRVVKIVPPLTIGNKSERHEILNALECTKCGYVPNGDVFNVQPKMKLE